MIDIVLNMIHQFIGVRADPHHSFESQNIDFGQLELLRRELGRTLSCAFQIPEFDEKSTPAQVASSIDELLEKACVSMGSEARAFLAEAIA